MIRNVLLNGNGYDATKLTRNVLLTPLERIIGTKDLCGRVEAYSSFQEAAGYSVDGLKHTKQRLQDFVRYMNTLDVTMPGDVTSDHIIAFVLHKKKTCNSVSVNTFYRTVRAWFNWMADPDRKIVEKSPFTGLKTPAVPKTVIKPLTKEQIKRILDCCPPYFRGSRNKAIVLLIYDSGLRRREVANIRLEDIDFQRGAIKVMGKGAKERYVGFGTEAKKALLQYLHMRDDSLPWLFVTQLKAKRAQMTPQGLSEGIQELMKYAGITGVKLGTHTLRHSFATEALRRGANLFYLQSLLGHSTLNMTRKYAATVNSEEAVSKHHTFSPGDGLWK